MAVHSIPACGPRASSSVLGTHICNQFINLLFTPLSWLIPTTLEIRAFVQGVLACEIKRGDIFDDTGGVAKAEA